MDLKWSLSQDSQFKFHVYLGWWRNRGSRQSFHVISFSKDCRLIILKHKTLNKNKMHGNTDMTLKHMIRLRAKNTYVPGLFSKPSLFTKIKLKRPLSRGSHFKIYFRLECRKNRGSHQNFHGVFFSKDLVLINSDHIIFLISS